MKSSGFKVFHFILKFYEIMSSRHRTFNLHSNTLSENEIDDNKNLTENSFENRQSQTSVETNKNQTDNIQQNPLQFPESFELWDVYWTNTNPYVELQQQSSEGFSSG